MVYTYNQGVQKEKRSKIPAIIGALLIVMLGISLIAFQRTFADSSSTNFEPDTYILGNINNQNGWSKTGSYDSNVVLNDSGYTSFGTQSLKISNAVTSGSFGDQTFAPSLAQQAGESGSWDKNNNPVASPQAHFESQFDFASSTKAQQSGLAISVSPDNGNGARMSYLRFADSASGIDVFFVDVQGTAPADFVESKIATLSYAASHTIKFSMDFYSGPSNDVVKIYIDGNLAITGTSWENYYRYDTESNPDLVNVSRTVSTMLFRAGGSAVPDNANKGYLFDNLSMLSGPILPVLVGPATNKDQCKNNGWKVFNNPTYKNQGDCVSSVVSVGRNK